MPLNMVIPVGTGTSVGTGVTTYSGLLTTIGDWLNRSDLTTKIPDFITLFEARLNRVLRVPEMEESATLTIADGVADLPADFLEIRHVYADGDVQNEVTPASLSVIRRDYNVPAVVGRPLLYAVHEGQLHFGPQPDVTEVELLYYEKIIALSDANETNWLIVSHPDIYLYGTLVMAEAFIWDDERLPLWRSALDEALGELADQGNRKRHGGGPLFPRPLPRPTGRS